MRAKAVGFFKNIILTKKGKEMLLSSNNNIDGSIEFNICKFGDGRYLESEIATATDIKSAWMEQNINTVRIDNSSSVPKLIIEITFSNKDMTEPKIMSELGIFAKDESGENQLFAYCLSNVETGEDIEIENDYPTTFRISIISIIDNNTNIVNVIDPDGFLTKEVIELLKESIRNIAFRKIQGTLETNQKVIQVPTDILLPISERAILNIEGEIYFLGRDYTIDIHANTITLSDTYNFEDGTRYEIIDPLPATYVKEQINEFIEDFEKLVSDSKIEFGSLKEEIYLEFKNKVDELYIEFDKYVEKNKEDLKGHSIDKIVSDGQDEDGGNVYKVIRDDEKEIGVIVSPKGDKGENGQGVINWENGENSTEENPTAVLILEDGSRTSTELQIPVGPKGDSFNIVKTYNSISEMENDFSNEEIYIGDYVVISSDDDDNAKLFMKGIAEFEFMVQMAISGADFVNLEFVRFDDEGNTIVKSKNSKGKYGDEILIKRGPRGYTGGTVGEDPAPPSMPYGTKIEWAGSSVPEGWALCNGGTLSGARYPQLIGVLDSFSEPTNVAYKFTDGVKVTSSNSTGISGKYYWRYLFCNNSRFRSEYYKPYESLTLNDGKFYSDTTVSYANSWASASQYTTMADPTDTHVLGYISEL